ncbi:MAG TPA: hypothetical protein VE957_03570 [Terriglobales bacterium]|nr:hypothetical protein [Terriglobales bacterium]
MHKAFSSILTAGLFFLSASASATTYTTNFPLTENPISEGGKWVNGGTVGLDWTNILTTAGIKAYGSSTGSGSGYDDSTAVLQGYGPWGQNQSATGTVYLSGRSDSYYPEVEIRLNVTISAHSIVGYECNYSTVDNGGQYSSIVRWNGSFGAFTQLATKSGASLPVLQNGDTWSCQNVNGVISSYRNGVLINSATDTTYTGGSPGIGTDLSSTGCGCNGTFGFSSFTATDGSTQANFTVSAAPASQTVTPGTNAVYTVNVSPSGGFTGTVSLSASGLPSGATASFNPSSVTTSGSSTLTVGTAS